jgi:SAM-dependent methyltransferase
VPGSVPSRDYWETHAAEWAESARTPDHDVFYWHYSEPSFLAFVPPPGRLTLDVGCGEGRLARALIAAGHRVVAIDGSLTLAELAAITEPTVSVAQADATALPAKAGAADLVLSFMVLMDVEDLDSSVAELARVLAPDGVLCVGILHPVDTAGLFLPDDPNHTFYLGEYRRSMRHVLRIERNGLGMTCVVEHRPIEVYSQAFERAGLVITAIREPIPTEQAISQWPELADHRRVGSFLYVMLRHA